MGTTLHGTIKRLVSDKGFGFVQAADGTEYSFISRRASTHDSMNCAKGNR